MILGRGGAFRLVGSGLAVVSLAVVCCGCETTAEKSAALERRAKHVKLALRGTSVSSENPRVKVVGSAVIHSSVGTAVVVTLRNTSSRALVDAPIEITVRDARGSVLFHNDQPGLEPSLTRVSMLEPGVDTVWVDDQVQVAGEPASASALVGAAKPVTGEVPRLAVLGAHLTGGTGDEAEAVGTMANRSRVTQRQLVVYVLARRGARVVAAGRAVLAEVPPGATAPFQAYFVGDPRGARVQMSAPPTNL